MRGISRDPLPPLALPDASPYAVNIALEQYGSADELQATLALVREAGFGWVRQRFPWREIEPQPGQFDWARWDAIVAATRREGLALIAVLDTAPAWAQSPAERQNPLAPPQYDTPFALFAGAFAARYGDEITCYQVWDQPNIYPHWGSGEIDPAAYARLLALAAKEIRAADDDAVILSAGLAPNTEEGGRNMSEVAFLEGLYHAGAADSFDVVAAKPYGFWSGPDDRRVDPSVLNFSRLILMREAMVANGDAATPIWAVEFGWNALPDGWQGRASPWGTDSVARQRQRVEEAVQRARQEWPWLGVLGWAEWQPAAPPDDPRWGFALLDAGGHPLPFYSVLHAITRTAYPPLPPQPAVPAQLPVFGGIALLAFVGALAIAPRFPWRQWGARAETAYLSASEWRQWAAFGLALAAYYLSPWLVLSLALLGLLFALTLLRLDLALWYTVVSVPLFLFPKVLLGMGLSLVEVLTLACVFAVVVRAVTASPGGLRSLGLQRLSGWARSLSSLDRAVLFFGVLGAVSILFSSLRGVSIREYRLVVFEPVLFYLVLRQARLRPQQWARLADALVLSGVAVSLYGLYQYAFTDAVIVAEGVRRIRAMYGSPNNVSLFLGRMIPVAAALALTGSPLRRRWHALALAPMLLCLFLTYSRAAWLLGLPAALVSLAWLRGQRTSRAVLGVLVICGLLIVPLAGTERLTSLLDFGQGTSFRRIRLWQASVDMIRDYPLTGVGLDNFLYRYPEYMLADAWEEPNLSHPHNIVLDYWTRLGIGGVVALLWLLGAYFALALSSYRRLPDGDSRGIMLGFTASMVGTVVHGLVDNSYFLVDLAFAFMLNLAAVQAMAGPLNVQGDE